MHEFESGFDPQETFELVRIHALWLNKCLPWGMFGSGGVEMFRQALARNGFAPEQVGPKFILRLPSRPIAGANAERQRRLHHIAG